MKTVTGIKSYREAEYFFATGADELYCGLFEIPNNRPFCENFSSVTEIERLRARSARKSRITLKNCLFAVMFLCYNSCDTEQQKFLEAHDVSACGTTSASGFTGKPPPPDEKEMLFVQFPCFGGKFAGARTFCPLSCPR